MPMHLGREVTNELTVRPQPPTRTSWVLPLGALARQRCLPCQVFVIKVDPVHQKQALEIGIQVGLEALGSSMCQGGGWGCVASSLASRSEPSASFTLSGHLRGNHFQMAAAWGRGSPPVAQGMSRRRAEREVFP